MFLSHLSLDLARVVFLCKIRTEDRPDSYYDGGICLLNLFYCISWALNYGGVK